MFVMESCAAVRRFVLAEGHSRSEAASVFGLSRDTVRKTYLYSAPPGCRRTQPPTKSKLGTLLPVIDAILDVDRQVLGRQQQHTAKWLFGRRRDERGYTESETMVKNHVPGSCEMSVPLARPTTYFWAIRI